MARMLSKVLALYLLIGLIWAGWKVSLAASMGGSVLQDPEWVIGQVVTWPSSAYSELFPNT